MQQIIPEKLAYLAKNCPSPLYVVGGSVRDFLAGLSSAESDWDICSPMSADVFLSAAEKSGFFPQAVYRHTGTVKLKDADGVDYEYTCFRSDRYVRGTHVPVEIFFTEDIVSDAKRRDFTANAVYYDIAADAFADPLNGISDIRAKRLRTVDRAEKVFGEDGLRLMRLARQAGQLGFSPSADCLAGAKANAALIRDISPERIWAELCAVLKADKRYDNPRGHYEGLKALEQTGVLGEILPELTLGKDMVQRKDFHKYDVLEHSLRAVLYADEEVRLAALLHDVGKPFCTLRDGDSHDHAEEGARIAGDILKRLKAPKHVAAETADLVLWHMYDFDCRAKENKLRRFFVRQADLLEKLMLLKQADYSGCMDDLSPCPTDRKWQALLEKMQRERAPMRLRQLAVSGRELEESGIPARMLSSVLRELLLHCAVCPKDNKKERLLLLAPSALHTALERKPTTKSG